MKRLTVFIFIISSCISMHAQDIRQMKKDSKYRKKIQKMAEKEFAPTIRKRRIENYEVYGSTRTLGELLWSHRDSLETGSYNEIIVTTTNCPNVNLCQRKSFNDAFIQYATDVNSFVRGKIASNAAFDALAKKNGKEQVNGDQDKFSQAFIQQVSANVSNKLELSYALLNESKKEIRMEAHFLVEKDAARKIRELAFSQTISQLQQSNQISKEHLNYLQSVSDVVLEEAPGSN